MSQSYLKDIARGFASLPRRHEPNTWAVILNEYAARLAKMDLPEDAVVTLRELFEEVGRLMRDADAV